MAKRKTVTRRRTYRRSPPTRRRSTRSRSLFKGAIMNNVIDGALVGLIARFIPAGTAYGLASPAVPLAVGYFRKNPVLQTLGGLSLGTALANVIGEKVGVLNTGGTNGTNSVGWL